MTPEERAQLTKILSWEFAKIAETANAYGGDVPNSNFYQIVRMARNIIEKAQAIEKDALDLHVEALKDQKEILI